MKTDSLYSNFYDPSNDFLKEPRAFCYDLASRFIKTAQKQSGTNAWYTSNDTIKGILLLLFTWNFAAKQTKKLNFNNVRDVLDSTKRNLSQLKSIKIENATDFHFKVIEKIFEDFRKLMGQTGASKALSLLNPYLFVMWDTKIRKRLNSCLIKGIKNGERAEYYVKFLKGIQTIIRDFKIKENLSPGACVAKKIDEFNYVEIVMGG